MSKPSLSTGIGRTYQWCEGMEERRAADAIAEARMLIERNEPKVHGCHHRTLAQVANTPAFLARLGFKGPDAGDATFALVEALAAFVAE